MFLAGREDLKQSKLYLCAFCESHAFFLIENQTCIQLMLGHRQSVLMTDHALQFHEALLEDSLLMMQHGDQIADHVELRVQLMLAWVTFTRPIFSSSKYPAMLKMHKFKVSCVILAGSVGNRF